MSVSVTRGTTLLAAMALLATLLAGSSRVPHGTRTATAASMAATLFSDGLESGDFSAWSLVETAADGAATVESNAVASGSYAARFSATSTSGSYAYARKTLTTAQTDLDAAGDFDVTAEGPTTSCVPFLRLFDPSGTRLVNLYRANGTGNVWVQHSGSYYSTSGMLPLNTWGHVELHVITAGSGASTVQVWLNGIQVYQTTTASLGSAGVLTLQIGNSVASQPFTQVVDNVTISGTYPVLAPTPTAPPTSYRMEAEAMTPVGTVSEVGDPAASGGSAIEAWGNLSGVGGSATVSASGAYALTFGGHEDYYGGTTGAHAYVAVYLDGATTPVGGVYVTNTTGYPAYTITVPLSAGTHSFKLLFDNDAYGGSGSTDRNAYLDYVAIAAATGTPALTVTPTGRPALTATPTTTARATSTPTATPAAMATSSSDHAIKTVFLIVMENHNWSSIKGNPSAPYLNNTLLPIASHAEQYYNPPGNHPSLPNYLWLEAGTNFGIMDDNSPSSHPLTTTTHLVTLLSAAGISWKAYEENITGSSCSLTDSDPYKVHHDPFVYFDDVTNTQSVTSPTCLAHVRPYAKLATDLANNTVARYNFITPNLCDDMHDPCAPISDTVKQGDTWLSSEVPKILSAPAYQQGGALFITWDEGEGGDGPIGLIVLSPYARGHGYANTLHYTHSSTLRTLQEIFGVSPWLGDAANATDLQDLFTTFP